MNVICNQKTDIWLFSVEKRNTYNGQRHQQDHSHMAKYTCNTRMN